MDQIEHVNGPPTTAGDFAAAYDEYSAALQQLGSPAELEQRATDSFAAYVTALQHAAPSDEQQRGLQEAHDAYAEVVREAIADEAVLARFEGAFRAYVQSIQKAWADVDPDSLDASAIAELGQQMVSVAWMTATGEPPGSRPGEA